MADLQRTTTKDENKEERRKEKGVTVAGNYLFKTLDSWIPPN